MRDAFDARFEASRRRIVRIQRIILAFWLIAVGSICAGGAWLAFHPSAIGEFAGQIVAGFHTAAEPARKDSTNGR